MDAQICSIINWQAKFWTVRWGLNKIMFVIKLQCKYVNITVLIKGTGQGLTEYYFIQTFIIYSQEVTK